MDQTVPGIVDEPVIVLIFGQVAIAVISRCCRPVDTGDLVLPVRATSLGRAVGRHRIPVAYRIIIPSLGIGWGTGTGPSFGMGSRPNLPIYDI